MPWWECICFKEKKQKKQKGEKAKKSIRNQDTLIVGEGINYSEGVLAKPTKINYNQITEVLVDWRGVRTSELQLFISKNLGRRGRLHF